MNDDQFQPATKSSDQITILMWLETASVEQIRATRSLSSAVVKADIDSGIRSLMSSDRPGLALDFPDLLTDRIYLADLAGQYPEFFSAVQCLPSHSTAQTGNRLPMGSGKALAFLRTLEAKGTISAAQHTLLIAEIKHYTAQ